jgi:hypothetical protein
MQSRASIFYQSEHGNIIHAMFECDWRSGKFTNQSYESISDDSPSVNKNTGLVGLWEVAMSGDYHVYFHDEDNLVNEIVYTTNDTTNDTTKSGRWNYHGVVSPHRPASNAIAAFTWGGHLSVVVPRDPENIEVDRFSFNRFSSDETWHICEFHPPPPLHPLIPSLTLQ